MILNSRPPEIPRRNKFILQSRLENLPQRHRGREIAQRKKYGIVFSLSATSLPLCLCGYLVPLFQRLLLLLGIIALSGCGSNSGSSKPRIGIDSTWAPLNFGSQTPYVNGFTEELLLEIAQHEGIEFEKISANGDDLISGLKEKKYDAILTSLPPYSFHLAKYDFSQNFLDVGPVFVVGMRSPYKKIDQVKGEAVGIVSGDAAWFLLQKYPEIIIQTFPSAPDLLNAVAEGEIAGALLDRIPAVNYVSDLYRGKLKIVSPPMNEMGLRLVAEKGRREELVRSFDSGIKYLKKKKKLKSLMRKWSL